MYVDTPTVVHPIVILSVCQRSSNVSFFGHRYFYSLENPQFNLARISKGSAQVDPFDNDGVLLQLSVYFKDAHFSICAVL